MSCCCSPFGPGGAGGAIAPLPDALYVAQGAAAGGDGSIAKPFNTMAAGLLALANLGVNFGALLISPGDYSGEGVLHWTATTALMLKGYSAGVPFPDPFAGPNPQVQLPSITADTGNPDLYLDNVTSALSQQFNGFTNIFGVGCELQTVLTAGNLSLRDSRMVGSMNVGGDVRLWNCEAQTDSNWSVGGTSVELVGTKLTSFSAPIVFSGTPGLVTVDTFSNFYFGAFSVSITNGLKAVLGSVAPQTAEFLLTGPTISAGDTDVTTTGTFAGFPYAGNATLLVQATLQFSAHVVAGYFDVLAQMQMSPDGGGSWSNIGNARRVSAQVNNNPTFFEISLPALGLTGSATADVQLRIQVTNDAASASAITNVDAAVTAIAGQF